jgi:hypothetical protein
VAGRVGAWLVKGAAEQNKTHCGSGRVDDDSQADSDVAAGRTVGGRIVNPGK